MHLSPHITHCYYRQSYKHLTPFAYYEASITEHPDITYQILGMSENGDHKLTCRITHITRPSQLSVVLLNLTESKTILVFTLPAFIPRRIYKIRSNGIGKNYISVTTLRMTYRKCPIYFHHLHFCTLFNLAAMVPRVGFIFCILAPEAATFPFRSCVSSTVPHLTPGLHTPLSSPSVFLA